MATNTYVALDKVTVGTAVNSITFSNISQNYTDLVIVANFTGSGSGNNLMMQVGNTTIDTGSNYSGTGMYGNGSSAASWRQSSVSAIQATYAVGLEAQNTSNIHLMNYSNTTTYKTILNRSGGLSGTYNATEATVSLWRSTSAINTIKLYGLNSSTISTGSTFSLYGIAAASIPTAKATGGTTYYDIENGYWYHAFTSSGTFTPTQALSADILVVAGGGSGGGYFYGAGGGAGGLLGFNNQSLSATGYTIQVGAGGSYSGSTGSNGTNSYFGALTQAVGGGRGSNQYTSPGNGGSGGGGSTSYNTGGTGTTGQGNNGGNTTGTGSVGGGGAGGGVPTMSTTGGIGLKTYSYWGTVTATGDLQNGSRYYAGGGSGNAGNHGWGGGGGSSRTGSTNTDKYTGMANTGGGAGSAGDNNGYNGGSGIVIIRYQG